MLPRDIVSLQNILDKFSEIAESSSVILERDCNPVVNSGRF